MGHVNPIAININFDSLNEAYGFPEGYRDPSFFYAFDRFIEVANLAGVPLSIYIIGKDLTHPEVFARVRDWSKQGHEIGNHTWSHPMSLGAMSAEGCREEIWKAHDIITRCIGQEPKGFIAPAWSTSKTVFKNLIELKYEYDTSVFPSFFLYPMILKIALNHWGDASRLGKVLSRKDWFYPFTFPRTPFFLNAEGKKSASASDGILVLPLPTLSRFACPFWHTTGFLFGWTNFFTKLERYLKSREIFYYLLHPMDFLGVEDMDSQYKHSLARANIDLTEKMGLLEKALKKMTESGRPIRTMRECSKFYMSHHRH